MICKYWILFIFILFSTFFNLKCFSLRFSLLLKFSINATKNVSLNVFRMKDSGEILMVSLAGFIFVA